METPNQTPAPIALSADLRELRDLMRKYVGGHQRPSIDACRELYVALNVMAEKADALEVRATVADDLEAVARDLDLVPLTPASPALQRALKLDQRAIQARIDACELPGGSFLTADDRGLVQLACAIGESNVVTFPVVPRPAISRVDCQGEGRLGEGGDVA